MPDLSRPEAGPYSSAPQAQTPPLGEQGNNGAKTWRHLGGPQSHPVYTGRSEGAKNRGDRKGLFFLSHPHLQHDAILQQEFNRDGKAMEQAAHPNRGIEAIIALTAQIQDLEKIVRHCCFERWIKPWLMCPPS